MPIEDGAEARRLARERIGHEEVEGGPRAGRGGHGHPVELGPREAGLGEPGGGQRQEGREGQKPGGAGQRQDKPHGYSGRAGRQRPVVLPVAEHRMTLDTEVTSLRQVPLFREVEPARLKLLAFTSERVHFEPGQRFFARGDVSDAAYVILDGSAEVSIDGPAGPVRLALLGADALVGEMGILADQPRSATVTAETAVTALRIDRGVFLELLAQFPQISIALMRVLATRLEQTNQALAESRG